MAREGNIVSDIYRKERRQAFVSVGNAGDDVSGGNVGGEVSDAGGEVSGGNDSESGELSEETDEDNDKDDPDYKVPDNTPKGKKLNPAVLELADRFNISNQAAVGFNNILQPGNSYTTSRLFKARQRGREAASVRDFSSEHIFVVGFDEREDHTFRGNGVREEHCSVVFYSSSGDHHAGYFFFN